MRFSDYVSIAVHQLKKNRLRTILTVLGIMIGIASMITVMSVGGGGQQMINDELLKFGINRIWLFSNDLRGPNKLLTLTDAQMLQKVRGVKDVAPSAYEKAYLSKGGTKLMADVVGTTEALFVMEQMGYLEGHGLTKKDIDYVRQVVVLSEEAKNELFGNGSAVGNKVNINGQKLPWRGERRPVDIFVKFSRYIPISIFNLMFSNPCGRNIRDGAEHRRWTAWWKTVSLLLKNTAKALLKSST